MKFSVILCNVFLLTQAGVCEGMQNNKDDSGINEEWNLEITVSNLEE